MENTYLQLIKGKVNDNRSISGIGLGIVTYKDDGTAELKHLIPYERYANINLPGQQKVVFNFDKSVNWSIEIPNDITTIEDAYRYLLFKEDVKSLELLSMLDEHYKGFIRLWLRPWHFKTVAKAGVTVNYEDLRCHSDSCTVNCMLNNIITKYSFLMNAKAKEIDELCYFIANNKELTVEDKRKIYLNYFKPWYEVYKITHSKQPYGVLNNCGRNKRTITYIKNTDTFILGCFSGSYDKAVEAIERDYEDDPKACEAYKKCLNVVEDNPDKQAMIHFDSCLDHWISPGKEETRFISDPLLNFITIYADAETVRKVSGLLDIHRLLFLHSIRPADFTIKEIIDLIDDYHMWKSTHTIHTLFNYVGNEGTDDDLDYLTERLRNSPYSTAKIVKMASFINDEYFSMYINSKILTKN